MNILITGIHGFVGSNLVIALKERHCLYGLDIVAPEKEGVIKTFFWKDIEPASFPMRDLPEFDAIIHLAGKAHDMKNRSAAQSYFDINTGLTQKIFNFFIWPTHWHFVASIIILYVPLFFVLKYIEMNRLNYWCIALSLFMFQLVLYLTIYDYSYYHIDKVREPMIEFLFFQSMLLGLHYRWRCNNEKKLHNRLVVRCLLGGVMFAIYFVSKLLFVKFEFLSAYQLLNQIVLWLLLYFLFQIFMEMENKLKKFENGRVWKFVKFIADRTLEIYLVQYVILDYLKIGPFPLNWLLLTTIIFVSAVCLRWLSQQVITRINI